MTGREMLEFLQSLDDEELEADVEIKADYQNLRRGSYLWAVSIGYDCNGIYVMDEESTDRFKERMCFGDKCSEVEE